MFDRINENNEGIARAQDIDWHNPDSVANCLMKKGSLLKGGDQISVIRYANEHLVELGSLLFNSARSAEGKQKTVYATALIKLSLWVEKSKYDEMLKALMTNRSTLEEFNIQGWEEEKKSKSIVLKIKKLLAKKE